MPLPTHAAISPRVATRGATRTEQLIGRSAALCAHPVIGWHARARYARTRVVAGYFALGFAGTIAGLLLLA
jgi:hypothetical protein